MAMIYLSSTYSDLKVQRQAVYYVLRQMRYDVIAMEDYVATDQRPLEQCLADIAACDLYIGIFAWRYGYIPPANNPDHKSITELEYREAVRTGKSCLIFLLAEDASWSPAFMDAMTGESDRGSHILALRNELTQEKLVNFFSSAENLASLVGPAMHHWERTRVVTVPTDLSTSTALPDKMAREAMLKSMLIDHSSFLHDRLDSFVGRNTDLTTLHHLIREKTQAGGYITITGQPGQGKSSIIAKLVMDLDVRAYHFIPLNPGLDHQVSLLRDLMARLILKHQLPDLYVASENRAILRDGFMKLLAEIASSGKREVIFIDGLDQLKEELDGERDLSFLPDNPPAGIVFVLGTRPNDTLEPLKLSKPYANYVLPHLNRQDFDLILQHRGVVINKVLADRYYEAMQKSALYLDLAAKELAHEGIKDSEETIHRVADNPANIFSLSMARLKRNALEWREVIKPVLGVLLVGREPLARRHLRQIIGADDQRLGEGLTRLGGLIVKDGQDRYSLFHAKLQDYLRQDEHLSQKEYIFATDEVEHWHKILADWCKQDDLSLIWIDRNNDYIEQNRREYARRHYASHLYSAHEWKRLFAVLDDGTYGKAKVQYDPSTHSYMQDLDLGCRAINLQDLTREERTAALLRLWRYTLLRCSLISRADRYPLTAFRMLIVVGREQEALGLAEMLTDPAYKCRVLFEVAKLLERQPEREKDHIQLLLKAFEIVVALEKGIHKVELLEEVGIALASARQWGNASIVVKLLGGYDAEKQHFLTYLPPVREAVREREAMERVLQALGVSLARTQQWERAATTASIVRKGSRKALILQALAVALAETGQWERAEEGWTSALNLLDNDINAASVHALCEIALGFASLQLSERADTTWKRAISVAHSIEMEDEQKTRKERVHAFCILGSAFLSAKRWVDAQAMWEEAIDATEPLRDVSLRAQILRDQSLALAQSGQWQQAKKVAQAINGLSERAKVLRELAIVIAQNKRRTQAEAVWMGAETLERTLSLQNSTDSLLSMRELAMMLVQAKLWQSAEMMISIIEQPSERFHALRNLGVALAQAGEWERAEAVIKLLDESVARGSVVRALLIALAQAGQWERAETLARSIKESDERAWMLRELVAALARVQKWQVADKLWHEAEKLQCKKDSNWSWQRSHVLHELIMALAQAQQWRRAEQLVVEINESSKKNQTLRELVMSLGRAQQWQRAESLLNTIEDIGERARGIRELVGVLGRAGQWEQAEAVMRNAKVPEIRDGALRELVQALTQARQWKRAEAIIHLAPFGVDPLLRILAIGLARARHWDEAEIVVQKIEESWQKASALRGIVVALAQAQQLERAEGLAHTIQIESERSWALHELGLALVQAQCWEQVEDATRGLRLDWQRADVLRSLGIALVRAHQLERAEAIWSETEAAALRIVDQEKKAQLLRELGIALVQAQQPQRAQKVWQVAQEVARAIEEQSEKERPLRERMLNLPESVSYSTSPQEGLSVTSSLNTLGFELLRPQPLRELVTALARAQQWEQAELVIQMIEDRDEKSWALRELLTALTQLQLWQQAETLILAVTNNDERVSALLDLAAMLIQSHQKAQLERVWFEIESTAHAKRQYDDTVQILRRLAESMTNAGDYESLSLLIQRTWLRANSRGYAVQLLSLSTGLIALQPEMGLAFCEAFTWTNTFLTTWVDASLKW